MKKCAREDKLETDNEEGEQMDLEQSVCKRQTELEPDNSDGEEPKESNQHDELSSTLLSDISASKIRQPDFNMTSTIKSPIKAAKEVEQEEKKTRLYI